MAASSERLWLDLYRMQPENLLETPQPPPLLPGCRFPGCFPGFSPAMALSLKAVAHGPFLVRWTIDLSALSPEEREGIHLSGSQWIPPSTILLNRNATVSGFNADRDDRFPRLPVTVELDLAALRRIASGERRLSPGEEQLVLEIRQRVGGVEVNRWRFTYDFGNLPPAAAASPLVADAVRDRIVLQSFTGSPFVLLAYGKKLGARTTGVWTAQSTVEVDNMDETTTNVEVAVWSYDDQPLLHLDPELTRNADDIKESTPKLLEITPNLWLSPYASGLDNLVHCDYLLANQLFRSTRVGIELTDKVNSTGGSYSTVEDLCDGVQRLKQDTTIYTAKNINIYYLPLDYVPEACCSQNAAKDAPEVLFITGQATPTTLAHELGHSFGLAHEETAARNLMNGGALDRSVLTLRQAYLMIFGEESTLNTTGLRSGPTREKQYCPAHCGASAIWRPECVDSTKDFPSPAPSPAPLSKIEALLAALASEERPGGEVLQLLDVLKADPQASPNLVPFLDKVMREGLAPDPVTQALEEMHRLIENGCAIGKEDYIALYRQRILKRAQFAGADFLFALHTKAARDSLIDFLESAPGPLRKHIARLLDMW